MMRSPVPTKRIGISDFWYQWPKVRSFLRPPHYKSMGKKLTLLYLLWRKPIWVESYRIGQLWTIWLKICIAYPSKGKRFKNLGLIVDKSLNFQVHVDTMTRKCVGILMALSHARRVIPGQALRVIVESLVVSVVRYCLSIYGSCGTTQVRKIQKIINFCARVVTGRRRSDHISDAIRILGWLTAKQLIDFHTVCAVRRVIVTEEPASLYRTICPRAADIHQHDTRRAGNWTLPRIRTESGRRRLCYRGVRLLNEHRLDPAAAGFRATLKAAVRADNEWACITVH